MNQSECAEPGRVVPVDRCPAPSEPAPTARWPKPLLGLLLVSLALRLLLVAYYAPKPLVSDFAVYAADAARIARGEALLDDVEIANRAPGFPLLLAALLATLGPSLVPIYAVQAMLWTAAGLLTWAAGREALGERGALAASSIVMFHPDGIVAGGLTGVESLAALLLALLLFRFAASCAKPLRTAGVLFDGALGGAAALTVAPLALLAAAALPAIALLRRRRGLPIARLAWFPFGAALVLAPWIVRNAVVLGRFVPLTTITGTALLGGNNPAGNGEWNEAWIQERSAPFGGATGRDWDRAAYRESASFVLRRPGQWLMVEGMKLGKFFSPKPGSFYRGRLFHPLLELSASPLFWMPLLFLLPFGIARARGLEPAIVFAALAVGSQLVTTLVFFALARYRIPYLPAYASLAVAGGQWIRARTRALPADRQDGAGGFGSARSRLPIAPVLAWSAFLIAVWAWILIGSWDKVRAWLF